LRTVAIAHRAIRHIKLRTVLLPTVLLRTVLLPTVLLRTVLVGTPTGGVGAGGGPKAPLAPPPRVCVCERECVGEGMVLSCAIGWVCYRGGALSGVCAIYFVCYRDVGYRVGALSGIVSIFRVLSGWCAIAPCANGTHSLS